MNSAMDLNQGIAKLDGMSKHWRLECHNRKRVRRYNCKVWADGKRFTVFGCTPIEAVNAAIERIKQNKKATLKLVG